MSASLTCVEVQNGLNRYGIRHTHTVSIPSNPVAKMAKKLGRGQLLKEKQGIWSLPLYI